MKSRLLRIALGLSLVACSTRAPTPGADTAAPIRLLDLAGAADASWPAWVHEWPLLERRPDILALASDDRVARITMVAGLAGTHDARVALLAPAGARYRFPVHLPRAPRLRFGLGYLPPPGAGATLDFMVVVTTTAGVRTEVSTTTVTATVDGRFRDVEVDLAPWAGLDVSLELAVTGPDGVWAGWAAPEIVASAPALAWDVLLVSLDTLRADHLGSYGYHRPTTPHLDAFARRATRFEYAISQSPWTRPSHRALFTGLHPQARGGRERYPLARALRDAGFRTTAITGGGQVDGDFGFADGFEQYRSQDWLADGKVVADWLASGAGRKSFLFLHTYEIHDPYTDPRFTAGLAPGRIGESFALADYIAFGKELSDDEKVYAEALYDGGIAHTDERLGELLDNLERSGRLARTIVAITSDHGEQFWEHDGWRHGQNMHDHQLRVPLILYVPPALRSARGIAIPDGGQAVTQQVRLIDVYPTLLDLIGIPLPVELQGRSLVPLLAGRPLPDVEAFAENTNTECCEQKALRVDGYKFIHGEPKTPGREAPTFNLLFDLGADPGEQRNLAEAQPELAEFFRARVDAIVAGGDPAELDTELPAGIDPELKEQLEALGYIGE